MTFFVQMKQVSFVDDGSCVSHEPAPSSEYRIWVMTHLLHETLWASDVEYFLTMHQLHKLRTHIKARWDEGAFRTAWMYFNTNLSEWGAFIWHYYSETICWDTGIFKKKFNNSAWAVHLMREFAWDLFYRDNIWCRPFIHFH